MARMKVTAQLTINCGCGFKAKEGKEAADHCAATGHILTVNGVVRQVEVPNENGNGNGKGVGK